MTLSENQRDQEFPNIESAAKPTGLSRRTIQFWVEIGAVEAIFVGGKCRVNFDSLKTYLKNRLSLTMENPMSRKSSTSPASQTQSTYATIDIEKLFESLRPQISDIVCKACASLGHQPQKMELDDFVERIVVLLMDNNYCHLRSFRQDSSPQTWLFTVAKHDIGKQLRRQSKMVSLEDFLPDSFISPPDQEERLISEERERILFDVISRLTVGEKKLFELLWEGKGAIEVAKELEITKESVWTKKSSLIKKIREILLQDRKGN
ncbi:MAG: sigma-70 family RNA polymerase sigma factor [Acidobacteria bacterium]|nr:sigma-70 family RNA polymerase sigma factor [Acidobacteriota bacterium]